MLPSSQPCLHVISNRVRVNIPTSDIRFIEVFDWKCIIHCGAGVDYETNTPLKNIQSVLPCEQFIRCNRSFLINLDHIRTINRDTFFTDLDAPVPISVRRRADVHRQCTSYLSRKRTSLH